MKSWDNFFFWIIIIIGLFIGLFIFNSSFNHYSDLITFLSIMVGFKISALAILFNSTLKVTLYDRMNKTYRTELHRLKDFFKHSLYFEIISVMVIFFMPDKTIFVNFIFNVFIGKYLIVSPILLGTTYCFYKICNDLFRIFTYPTIEK